MRSAVRQVVLAINGVIPRLIKLRIIKSDLLFERLAQQSSLREFVGPAGICDESPGQHLVEEAMNELLRSVLLQFHLK